MAVQTDKIPESLFIMNSLEIIPIPIIQNEPNCVSAVREIMPDLCQRIVGQVKYIHI